MAEQVAVEGVPSVGAALVRAVRAESEESRRSSMDL